MLTVFRTEIKIGNQVTFAYSANETDPNGNPINYLNNAQLAELIGLNKTTALQTRMSEELKVMLGKDWTATSGCASNKAGAITKLSLWTMNDAAIYLLYHAQKGNSRAIELLPFFPIDGDRYQKMMETKGEKPQTQKSGYIYLLDSGTVLKLGYSTNVKARLKALQRWDGELELLITINGTIFEEQKFHRYLKATGDSFGDEWYPTYRKLEILNLLQAGISTLVTQ